jgi:hypothetical protein
VVASQKSQRKGGTKIIKVEGDVDKEQEVIVRHKTAPQKRVISIWSWHEEFAIEWSKTLITGERKRSSK